MPPPYVVPLKGFSPPAITAGNWASAIVQESAPATPYVWANLQTFALPADPDPSTPASYDFTVTNAQQERGVYRVTWVHTTGATATSDPVTYGTVAGYPSLSTVLAAVAPGHELLSMPTGDQAALHRNAIAAVEAFAGQSFTSQALTRLFDAQGGNVLYLDRRLDSLTAVVMTGSSLVASDLILSEKRDRLHIRRDVGRGYYAQAMWEMQGEAPGFPVGDGVVSISGVWGWPSVPDAVFDAIRFDMEDNASNPTQAGTAMGSLATMAEFMAEQGIEEVSQYGLRIRASSVGSTVMAAPSVSARVARALLPYQWHPPAGIRV